MDALGRAGELIAEASRRQGPLVFLTGAGVSAESGIPTFRGPEGYWKIGSVHYRPEELATQAAFSRMPEEIWAWYLHRRAACRAAAPNAAHLGLAQLEAALGDRFLLITQNVDGLHLRAGNTRARTYEIHGNLDFLRCAHEYPALRPMPAELTRDWTATRPIDDRERALLRCPHGDWSRPHVLWFDESYDEPLFRFESSIEAARRAAMLVVVGTSGATNLPSQLVALAAQRGLPLIVVNQDESRFTELADRMPTGAVLRGSAAQWVPLLADALRAHLR